MARKQRFTPIGVPIHVVQRGVDGSTTFRDARDFKVFLKWLKEYAIKWQVAVHAWVLMGNHIHLLITPKAPDSASGMMGNVCGRYAHYFNRRYDRTGSLWQGRYYSCIVASNYYLMCCYRYIELNPVRASLVENVVDYQWSSFRCNGMGYESDLHEPHGIYLGLGANKGERLVKYRQLFGQELLLKDLDCIRRQTLEGGVLVRAGNEKLVQERISRLL